MTAGFGLRDLLDPAAPSALTISHQPTCEDHMAEQASAQPVERVAKPWGHEEIFAIVEGSYVGKTLHVAGGESRSLHWHRDKDETIAVLSGQVESRWPAPAHPG